MKLDIKNYDDDNNNDDDEEDDEDDDDDDDKDYKDDYSCNSVNFKVRTSRFFME